MVSLVLAALGVFGVTAYAVGQRTRELGIRVALGAAPRAILLAVLRPSARLVVAGMGLGLLVSLLVSSFFRSFAYGVAPIDPPSIVGAVLLLALVALVASWLPARRATRVSSMLALRAE